MGDQAFVLAGTSSRFLAAALGAAGGFTPQVVKGSAPHLAALTSVTHGRAGWLAVGARAMAGRAAH